MTKSQCTKIIVLYDGNRIPGICLVPRWYQTTKEKGTSIFCINATKECQRVMQIPSYSPIIQRRIGTMKQNAGFTIQFGWRVWTNPSHKGKQNQKGAVALGYDPPAGI